MSGFITQPHGGAIKPGLPSKFVPAHGGSSFKAAKKKALALAHANTEAAVQVLVDQLKCDDPRVAHMAAIAIRDMTLGKPTEIPMGNDAGSIPMDLSHLTQDERGELALALATIHRLTGRNLVIDG